MANTTTVFKFIVLAALTAVLPVGCDASPEQEQEQQQENAQQKNMAAAPPQEEVSRSPQVSCWPLQHFRYSRDKAGGWLASRYRGSYHLGVDMFALVGTPVRAIADGVVHDVSTGGWGPGSVALMIKHQRADGRWFIALYGHIRTLQSLRQGSKVRACSTIGAVGPYRRGSHLHFGVIAPGRLPRPPYGTSERSDHNAFIDPVRFLQNFSGSSAGGMLVRHQEQRPATVSSRVAASPRSKVVAAASPVIQEKTRPAEEQGQSRQLQTSSRTVVKQAGVRGTVFLQTEQEPPRKIVAATEPVIQEKTRPAEEQGQSRQLQTSSKTAVKQAGLRGTVFLQTEQMPPRKVVATTKPVIQEKSRSAEKKIQIKQLQASSKTAVSKAAAPAKIASLPEKSQPSKSKVVAAAAPVIQEKSRTAIKQLQASSKTAVSKAVVPASIQSDQKKRKPALPPKEIAESSKNEKKQVITKKSRQKQSLPALKDQSKRAVSARKQP